MTYNIQTILTHYLACALWTDDKDTFTISDIGASTVATATKDIESFVEQAGDLLNDMDEEQIGHDFWLTRNHHGAGFWDRDLGEVGDKLTKLAQKFKSLNVWQSELDIIYFE